MGGSHCAITYPMVRGRKYSYRVVMSEDTKKMSGYITDTSSGAQTKVGTLVYPDYKDFSGFGLIQQNAAAFQEYFLSSGCDNQAMSSVGLIGPFFKNRSVYPQSATPAYAGVCQHADVHACIEPGDKCGPTHVFLLAGGQVTQKTPAGTQLWNEPYPGTTVSCGEHTSDCCMNCDQGRGASWCKGDCEWSGKCSPKGLIV